MDAIDPPINRTAEENEEWQAVLDKMMHGKPLDPVVEKRIRDKAERLRQELLATHGVTNIAVDLIREVRDEE
jgi:hypothetical protein